MDTRFNLNIQGSHRHHVDMQSSVLGQIPRGRLPPDNSPAGRLPRRMTSCRSTPPEDDSPRGQLPRRTSIPKNNSPEEEVVLRGSHPPGELSCGGVILRGSCPDTAIIMCLNHEMKVMKTPFMQNYAKICLHK